MIKSIIGKSDAVVLSSALAFSVSDRPVYSVQYTADTDPTRFVGMVFTELVFEDGTVYDPEA